MSKTVAEAKAKMMEKMTKMVRAAAITCYQDIIIGSPVDSGRFRANWQASINQPVAKVTLDGVETKKDSNGLPIKNQFTKTADVVSQTSSYNLDDILYLTNNLPYAVRLENGWSQQRGAGWVNASLNTAKENLRVSIANAKIAGKVI